MACRTRSFLPALSCCSRRIPIIGRVRTNRHHHRNRRVPQIRGVEKGRMSSSRSSLSVSNTGVDVIQMPHCIIVEKKSGHHCKRRAQEEQRLLCKPPSCPSGGLLRVTNMPHEHTAATADRKHLGPPQRTRMAQALFPTGPAPPRSNAVALRRGALEHRPAAAMQRNEQERLFLKISLSFHRQKTILEPRSFPAFDPDRSRYRLRRRRALYQLHSLRETLNVQG